jgi:choline dehydrogenase
MSTSFLWMARSPRRPCRDRATASLVEFSLLAPYSRGSVMLASSDPEAAPSIDPSLLADERDVAGMLAGLRVAREIGGSRALVGWRKEEALPGASVHDTEELRAFLRRSVNWGGRTTHRDYTTS